MTSIEPDSRLVRLVHTSDVHVGNGIPPGSGCPWPERSIQFLDRVVACALQCRADAILISGDLFDHNRVSAELAAAVMKILASAQMPVVILPGNHDPYTPDSIYRRVTRPANLQILSDGNGELILLHGAGVQIWGQAHVDYDDFSPFAAMPQWSDGDASSLWRIALGHGLYVRSEYERNFSYRIHDTEIEQLQAHYVGLGHLEHHEVVGSPSGPAYYAGAPERSSGVTMVELSRKGITVAVRALPQAT